MNARPRIAAVAALAFGLLGFALAAVIVIEGFPRGLIIAALVLASTVGGWYLIVGPLPARLLGGASVAAALTAALLLVAGDRLVELLLLIGAVVLCCLAARVAFGYRADLPLGSRLRSGRSCYSTRSPAAARRSASGSPMLPARAGSAPSSSVPATTSTVHRPTNQGERLQGRLGAETDDRELEIDLTWSTGAGTPKRTKGGRRLFNDLLDRTGRTGTIDGSLPKR